MASDSFYSAALDAIRDLERFAQFAWNGLGYANAERRVIEELRASSSFTGNTLYQDEAFVASRLKSLPESEAFAEEQGARGFPLLYELLVVRLWSILEGVVDDLVTWVLANRLASLSSETLRKLRGPLVEFAMASDFQRAEFLADLLSQELKAKLKQGVGRFESVLAEIGMGGGVSDPVRRSLLEFSEIRNIVVHRRGRADARMLANCPWFQCGLGERVPISPARFDTYLAATCWYIVELSRRQAAPDDARVQEYHREALGDLERRIERGIEEVRSDSSRPAESQSEAEPAADSETEAHGR